MELVNYWLPAGKFRKVDTPFRTDSTYEKDLVAALQLTVNALHKAEMEYYGNFGHYIGRIEHISLMIIQNICYAIFLLSTQTVAHNISGFQGIKRCIQYLASHPHKPIFYPYNYYDGSNFIRLTWGGNKFEDYTTHNFLEFCQYTDHDRIIRRILSVSGIIS